MLITKFLPVCFNYFYYPDAGSWILDGYFAVVGIGGHRLKSNQPVFSRQNVFDRPAPLNDNNSLRII